MKKKRAVVLGVLCAFLAFGWTVSEAHGQRPSWVHTFHTDVERRIESRDHLAHQGVGTGGRGINPGAIGSAPFRNNGNNNTNATRNIAGDRYSDLSGDNVHFTPGSAAINILDRDPELALAGDRTPPATFRVKAEISIA